MKTEQEKLLSCPFCGGEAAWARKTHPTMPELQYGVACIGTSRRCAALIQYRESEEQAADDWNTRYNASQWVAVSERLPENPNPWPIQVWAYIEVTTAGTHIHKFNQSAKFYKGEWTDDGGRIIEDELAKVVAWQYIAPYTPEDK